MDEVLVEQHHVERPRHHLCGRRHPALCVQSHALAVPVPVRLVNGDYTVPCNEDREGLVTVFGPGLEQRVHLLGEIFLQSGFSK